MRCNIIQNKAKEGSVELPKLLSGVIRVFLQAEATI